METLGEQINNAFSSGVISIGTIMFLVWFFWYEPEGQPPPFQRLKRHYLMSRSRRRVSGDEAIAAPEVLPQPETTSLIATPQNGSNGNIAAQLEAAAYEATVETLAKLIAAGKVTQTEAIRIGLGIKASGSNPRYTAARNAVVEAVARVMEPTKYPPLTEQERAQREELGLPVE